MRLLIVDDYKGVLSVLSRMFSRLKSASAHEGPYPTPSGSSVKGTAALEIQSTLNAPAHILIVEDDPTQLADISGALEAFAYRITAACSAEAALRHVEQTRFDVILTDNVLPGMTGLQALPRLRASGAPVIVMSSQYGTDTEKDALLIGAAAFIKKPLAIENLSRLIRQALDSPSKAV